MQGHCITLKKSPWLEGKVAVQIPLPPLLQGFKNESPVAGHYANLSEI